MRITLILAASMLVAQPALAQKTITSSDDYWTHEASGIAVPRTIGELQRGDITFFNDSGANVGFAFDAADPQDPRTITVYLYPFADGTMPIWFDRARAQIAMNERYYSGFTGGEAEQFTVPGRADANGLMAVFENEQSGVSTLLAMFNAGGMLAKLRLTYVGGDADEIRAEAMAVLAGIDWGADESTALATPVSECETTLDFDRKAKRQKAEDGERLQSTILGALFEGIVAEKKAEGAEVSTTPVSWCRDPEYHALMTSVYRDANASSRYLIASGDAGDAIYVYRHAFDAKNDKPRYVVEFSQWPSIYRFESFDGLPTPEKAIDHVQNRKPVDGGGLAEMRQSRVMRGD